MAPPLTLTTSSLMPRSSAEASPTAAKASLISNRSMSPVVSPAFSSATVDGVGRLVEQRRAGARHLAVADQLAERGHAELVGLGLGHHDDRGATVGDLGGVAGGDGAALVEGGAQLAERLGRGLRADTLVGVDDHRVALPLGHVDRDDLVGEPAVLDGGGGALVGEGAEGVLALAGHAVGAVVPLGRRAPWRTGRTHRTTRRTSSSRRGCRPRAGSRPRAPGSR